MQGLKLVSVCLQDVPSSHTVHVSPPSKPRMHCMSKRHYQGWVLNLFFCYPISSIRMCFYLGKCVSLFYTEQDIFKWIVWIGSLVCIVFHPNIERENCSRYFIVFGSLHWFSVGFGSVKNIPSIILPPLCFSVFFSLFFFLFLSLTVLRSEVRDRDQIPAVIGQITRPNRDNQSFTFTFTPMVNLEWTST